MSERPEGIFETASGKLGQTVYENQAEGCGPELRFFVEIAFVPFEWDDEAHRPLLRIDNLLVPVKNWQGLAGQAYEFPYAPKPGSLESAVLMFGEHNPADVTRIKFGAIDNGKLNCVFETEVDFEIEADRDDLEQIEMSLNLSLDVEPLRVSTSLEKRCQGDADQIAGAIKNVVDLSKYGNLEKLPGGFAYSITG
jgi:hypothetical protein